MSGLLSRLLGIGMMLALLALLEWAFGLGQFIVFFLVTFLIWFVPLRLLGRYYIDHHEPRWLKSCYYALFFVWWVAQIWYIATVPLILRPEQSQRVWFGINLLLLPDTLFRLFFYAASLFIGLVACVALVLALLKTLSK